MEVRWCRLLCMMWEMRPQRLKGAEDDLLGSRLHPCGAVLAKRMLRRDGGVEDDAGNAHPSPNRSVEAPRTCRSMPPGLQFDVVEKTESAGMNWTCFLLPTPPSVVLQVLVVA